MTNPIQRVVLIGHPRMPETRPLAENLVLSLEKAGLEACFGFLYNEEIHKRVKAHEFDLLIALGGDGTMLRAGHLAGPANLPILGVNLGHFGFLMELSLDQWDEFFPRLMSGDYWIEKRMMLTAEQWRGGERVGSWDVLNEVVVSRGQTVRPIKLATYVDQRFLTTYVADALIAATPTGSTAYALAAGGPILPPELRNILLVPVAPHLSLERAIVLAEGATVSINVKTDHQAVFSVDGQVPVGISEDDRIDVHAGGHSVHFIRFQDPGYFYRNLTVHMNHNPATRESKHAGGKP
jgi:NAD+ kinase